MAEIKRVPDFWDAATGYSDDVVVTSTKAVTIKKGTLLLSDGAGKYTPVTSMTAAVTARVAVALEEVAITANGSATLKAVKSGVVRIEEMYEAGGYTSATVIDYHLDAAGGISNIVFVHTKEVE